MELIAVTIHVESMEELRGVYALLGANRCLPDPSPGKPMPAVSTAMRDTAGDPLAPAADAAEQTTSGAVRETTASGEVELDAEGHPWSPELHASTKAKTGAGLWRMKPGQSRPVAVEGYPKAGTEAPAVSSAGSPSPAPTETAAEYEDEFAQFRQAAATTETAPVARTWTDADLSQLCNQAALKMGNPEPVKAILAKYVPEGEIPHSRNIPVENRELFAQEVEGTFEIQYAG